MNERIEQLAEQAGLLHEHMTTGERADYLKKFNALGKLLIKECIIECESNIVDYDYHNAVPRSNYNAGIRSCVEVMKTFWN